MTTRLRDVLPAEGDHASRPAAPTFAPAFYSCTEHGLIYRWDGTAWSTWATLAAASDTHIGAICHSTASQSCPDDAWTSVNFGVEDLDTDGFHDTVTNPSRFTIPTGLGGKYRFEGTVSFAPNATGTRFVAILINGVTRTAVISLPTVTTGQRMRVATTKPLVLADGNYVQLQAYTTNGPSEIGDTTSVGDIGETWAALTRLGS